MLWAQDRVYTAGVEVDRMAVLWTANFKLRRHVKTFKFNYYSTAGRLKDGQLTASIDI